MLKRLTVKNFKSLDGITFDFEPINLFIGPNSSGKSTALQAIEVLPALLRPSITEYFEKEKGWDYRDLPHRKNLTRTMSWNAEYHLRDSFEDDPSVFEYQVELQPRLHLGIGKEILKVSHANQKPRVLIARTGRETKILDESTDRYESERMYNLPSSVMQGLKAENGALTSVLRFRSYLERFQSFLLWNPRDLRRPHQGLAERLGPSGEHLPGFWAYLSQKEPQKAKELLVLWYYFKGFSHGSKQSRAQARRVGHGTTSLSPNESETA